MPRTLVLKDGVLSAEVVSYEQVELAQLEAEVASKQADLDAVQAEVDAVTSRLNEAQAALEDSKSEHEVAAGLVAQTADVDASEPTDEPSSDAVHVPVENL